LATNNNIFIVILYVKGSTNSHFLPKHSLCRRKVQVENQQDNNKKNLTASKKVVYGVTKSVIATGNQLRKTKTTM